MLKPLKQLRKVVFLLLSLGVLITPSMAKEPLKVITSFTIIQDMAKHVAGDYASIESVIKPGMDLHEYQPTPKDIAKVGEADLIIWNGLGMEQWFERFFENHADTPIIIASDGIVVLKDGESAESEGVINPHAWMSLKNGAIYVDNIRDALVKYDPENASHYEKNAERYKRRMKALDTHFIEAFANIPEKDRWIVSNESSMRYFADHYGFQEAYIWNALSDEEGTPKQVRALIDLVRDKKIKRLFSESTLSDRSMKQIAKESDAIYAGVIYTDSLSTKEGPVPSYLNLIDVTGNIILRAYGVGNDE